MLIIHHVYIVVYNKMLKKYKFVEKELFLAEKEELNNISSLSAKNNS